MIILLLFSLFRPSLIPVTNTDLIKVDSLTTVYQNSFSQTLKVEPTRAELSGDGKFIVFGFQPGCLDQTKTFIQKNLGQIVKISQTGGDYLLAYFPDFDVEYNRKILSLSEKMPFIQFAEPSVKMEKCFMPNDTYFRSFQWDKWVMYADLIWDVTLGSSDIIVAVCDEGVDYLHPDLRDNFYSSLLGYDFVDMDPDPYPDSAGETHGTHVAGIIGAVINNGIGVAGWAQVRLLSVRVLSEQGSGSDYDVAEGIRWSADNGARIINLSLGGYEVSTVLASAVEYAWNQGVLLFAATGNDGISNIYYPAKLNDCIAVGALAQDNKIAFFSNYGNKQELVCPGVSILSTVNDSSYDIYQGTSMACPQASGIAALILSLYPNLSNQRLRAILDVGTIDLGTSGKDNLYGYGLLNAYQVYSLALELATQDKLSRTRSKGLLTDFTSPKNISNPILIYDAMGRKIDKISTKGVYFLTDPKNNQKIKKVIVR
jgi:subtilisin family serine protease